MWRGSADGDGYRRSTCHASCGALANEARGRRGLPRPAAELVAIAPSFEHRRPPRPCPRRALHIGPQRSSTDNHGLCPCAPSCRIGPYRAVRGSSQARGSSSAGIDLARRGRQMRSLVADGAERPTAFAAGGTAKTVRGAEPPGRGDQLRRCRAPGRAASGRSHRARSAAPRRSTLLRGIPQPRRSLAGHGSSMV